MSRWIRLTGLSDYATVHALQRRLVEARIRDEIPDTILLLEHAPVITVGRKRDAATNVIAAGDWPIVEVERGGDVTWHGPGQLVAYPIVRLVGVRQDLHRHLHALEDAMIGVCGDFGVTSGRDARNTGVWIDGRKVGSIGIACRKWVTWHGLALNVDPDLGAFARIRPCGFDATVMTRLADHVATPAFDEVCERLLPHLAATLGVGISAAEATTAESLLQAFD